MGAATPRASREVAECERDSIVQAAERLRAAGHECPVVSGGSTPTAVYAEDLERCDRDAPGRLRVLRPGTARHWLVRRERISPSPFSQASSVTIAMLAIS